EVDSELSAEYFPFGVTLRTAGQVANIFGQSVVQARTHISAFCKEFSPDFAVRNGKFPGSRVDMDELRSQPFELSPCGLEEPVYGSGVLRCAPKECLFSKGCQVAGENRAFPETLRDGDAVAPGIVWNQIVIRGDQSPQVIAEIQVGRGAVVEGTDTDLEEL